MSKKGEDTPITMQVKESDLRMIQSKCNEILHPSCAWNKDPLKTAEQAIENMKASAITILQTVTRIFPSRA